MMKGMMGRCLNHKTTLERVRAKAEATKDELSQLKNWKSRMEKKFDLSVKKIKDLKGHLRQAKEEVVREYRDSNTLLSDLGSSFLEGFDDALLQVRKALPGLDLSSVKIEEQVQVSVVPIALENTDELFAGDATIGDRESA